MSDRQSDTGKGFRTNDVPATRAIEQGLGVGASGAPIGLMRMPSPSTANPLVARSGWTRM
jgi:hypothetical protein